MRRDRYRDSRRDREERFERDSQNFDNSPSGLHNWESARSDYGEYAYGGRIDKQARRRRNQRSYQENDHRRHERNVYENRDLNYYLHNPSAYPVGMMPYGFEFEQDDRDRGQNRNEIQAHEVMTRNVSTVFSHDSVQYAARLMRDEDCGAIPVVNRNGQLIGMITDRDITVRLVASGYDASQALVSDCMTREAFACHAGETIRDCMSVMSEQQVRRLPIVDDNDRVVGIVSQADLARFADRSRNRRRKYAFTDMLEDISEPASDSFITE